MTTTMSDVRIRTAAVAEHDRVRHVLRAAYRQHAAALTGAVYLDYIEDLLDLRPGRHRVLVLLAEVDGRTAGVATLDLGTRVAGIRAVAVLLEHRRAGIGRRLVRACVEHATDAGVRTLYGYAPPLPCPDDRLLDEQDFRRAPELDGVPVVPSRVRYDTPAPARAYRRNLAELIA